MPHSVQERSNKETVLETDAEGERTPVVYSEATSTRLPFLKKRQSSQAVMPPRVARHHC